MIVCLLYYLNIPFSTFVYQYLYNTGSHHICINLQSTASSGNFCEVTGQTDWCSDDKMPCHKNKNDKSCTPANWCVCQWAFRTYLQEAGGCDQIQDIQVSHICVSRVNCIISCRYPFVQLHVYLLSFSLCSYYFFFSARL